MLISLEATAFRRERQHSLDPSNQSFVIVSRAPNDRSQDYDSRTKSAVAARVACCDGEVCIESVGNETGE